MQSLAHETLINDILTFWFGDKASPEWGTARSEWFKKDAAFDDAIRQQFGQVVEDAAAGRLKGLATDPEGALALIITLDQFPRNIYRDSPKAFAADPLALAHAEAAIDKGWDVHLIMAQRRFMHMPLMHAEDLQRQDRLIALWEAMGEQGEGMKFALRHREIIARFGRFPHRNALLGRESTAEEIAFLQEPMSSF